MSIIISQNSVLNPLTMQSSPKNCGVSLERLDAIVTTLCRIPDELKNLTH